MKKQFSEKEQLHCELTFTAAYLWKCSISQITHFFTPLTVFCIQSFFPLRFVFHSVKDPHFFIFYTSFSAPSFFILIKLTFVSFKAGVGAISFFTKYRVTKPHEVSWLLMHSPQNLHTLFSVCLWSCESCLLRTQTLGKSVNVELSAHHV